MKDWVAAKLSSNASSFQLCSAIGVSRGTKIVAGFLYHRFDGHDCEITIAVEDKRVWQRRDLVRAFFAYPFLQLGCTRISCSVPTEVLKAAKLAMKLGFRAEGLKRRGYDGVNDAYILGMLREECRWLR